MRQGYFAGLIAGMVRRTRDGRTVTARRMPPTFPRRWHLVTPETQPAFEQRVKMGHLVMMGLMIVAVQFVDDPLSLRFLAAFAAFTMIVGVGTKTWMTRQLPQVVLHPDDLEPLNRGARHLVFARAMGEQSFAIQLAISVLLVVPQLYVAVTDGVWWAWVGTVFFSGCAAYFGWLLVRLRADHEAPRVS